MACVDRRRHAGAFTLMELLLVITIISVLTAIIAPGFFGKSQEARITAAKQMIAGSFSMGLTRFEFDNGRYPTSEEGLEALVVNPQTVNWQGPYLQSVTVPLDPWGNPYRYTYPSELTASEVFFDVISAGPDGAFGSEDDVTNHNLADNNRNNRSG